MRCRRGEHLAVHVELELFTRGVADAHGLRSLVAREPVDRVFTQPPFTGGAVHDLEVLGVAGDRAQEPVAPGERFFVVSADGQREQGEGGVPQPAVAVVPVPHTPDPFGQRCRRCGDDPARRGVGECLQRDERPDHRVAPPAGVRALGYPVAPPPCRVLDCAMRIDGSGRRLVRGVIRQHERHRFAGFHHEVGHGGAPGAVGVHRRAEEHRVRSGEGAERAVGARDPRHDRSVVEADGEIHVHGHPAAEPFDHPHDVDGLPADRHAVGHAYRSVVGVKRRLQYQGVGAVLAFDALQPARRRDLPTAVLAIAEERGEHRAGVEPRHTPPVDRSISADQGRGLGVADERVVLDRLAHLFPSWPCGPGRSGPARRIRPGLGRPAARSTPRPSGPGSWSPSCDGEAEAAVLGAERRARAAFGGGQRRSEQRVVDRDAEQHIGFRPGNLQTESVE